MFVLVVGCGRVGSALAKGLVDDGHDVNVVDQSPEAFTRLGDDFPGQFIRGPALETSVLEAAGIADADAFVAATNGDNTNIVIAQIAKRQFNVPTVIARILDPLRAKWYEEQGLSTVCPTRVAIEMLEERVREAAGANGASPES